MRQLAFFAVLAVAAPAFAQADPAADHYRAGVAKFKAGQYPEAISEFRAADAIRPSPVLSFNIAQCYEKMADLQNAKTAYQDYLRRAPNAEDKAAIEATITSIDQKLAEKQAQDTVVLVPSASAVEVRASPRRSPDYTLGIVTGGVGVAALVAGIVLNAVSYQNSQSLHNNGLNGNYFSQTQMQGFHDTAQSTWTGALIGYVAGGVLTAAGVGVLGYQYFTRPANP